MDAIVVYAPRDYRLEQKPLPQPGRHEVLAKVEAVGICASDGKCYTGAEVYWGKPGVKPPKVRVPMVPGHEFSCRVVALGEGSEEHHKVAVGDLVVAEQVVTCGKCRYCTFGHYEVCPKSAVIGFSPLHPGAMANYMILPAAARIHKVPMGVDPVHAAFAEPLSCGLHGVQSAGITFQDVVVVSGCGPVGLAMVAGAKLKGPKLLVAIDVVDWKLEIAKKCGADLVFNPLKCDLKAEICALSEHGCDVYMEVTGNPTSVHQGLDILAPLGRMVCYSVFRDAFPADWSLIGDVKELRIIGAHLGPHCWPKALDLLAGNVLPMTDIISHKFPLDKLHEAMGMVIDGGNSIKVVITPNAKY